MTTAIGAYATATLLKSRTGIPDTTDDTELGKICDQINGFIESGAACGRVIAPIASATYLINGDGSRCLQYPKGIRAVTLFELARYTTAAYETIPSSQFFLAPQDSERLPGFPYTSIEFTDYPTQGFTNFPKGYATVRLTMTTGFAAIPDEITDIALTAATKAWHSVESGQRDIVGTDAMGAAVVSRFFSLSDVQVLRTYSVNLPG